MNDWLDSYYQRVLENTSSVTQRHANMLQTNPKFVLKNYILQEAMDTAKKGDFTVVNTLFEIAKNPYAEHKQYERWAGPTPDEFKNKKLSCSS